MKKPLMICLVGRGLDGEGKFESSARVGKDEVAKMIAKNFGYRVSPFALPMKQTCQILFGLDDAVVWDDSKKAIILPHWDITPRQMYQRFGTEGGRLVFADNLWVDMMMRVWDDVKNERPFTFNLVTEKALAVEPPKTENDFNFIIDRAAQIMFQVTDTQVTFSRAHDSAVCDLGLTFDEIVDKLKNQTLPVVLGLPRDQAWEKFKAVRGLFPTFVTASMGPYGMPPKTAKGLCINDGRFPNELDGVRDNDGHVAYIERVLTSKLEKVVNHASETELPPKACDTILKNDGTMDQLEARVQQYVESKQLDNTPSYS